MHRTLTEKINFAIEQLRETHRVLTEERGLMVSVEQVQVALAELLGYEEDVESLNIIEHELDSEQMLELLKNYDFTPPEVLLRIDLGEDITPRDLTGFFEIKRMKIGGEVWEIHKYDKDHLPSNPHAHNKENGLKLHLGTGQLFNKTKPLNKFIQKKHLDLIRKICSEKNISLPPLER